MRMRLRLATVRCCCAVPCTPQTRQKSYPLQDAPGSLVTLKEAELLLGVKLTCYLIMTPRWLTKPRDDACWFINAPTKDRLTAAIGHQTHLLWVSHLDT